MGDVYREPAEESDHLYPGLVVHDDRVTGSITVGRSRVPLWAFIATAVGGDWAEIDADYGLTELGLTSQALATFLYHLTENRGEFGRLILTLADVERREWSDDAVGRVREQLERCLHVIGRG